MSSYFSIYVLYTFVNSCYYIVCFTILDLLNLLYLFLYYLSLNLFFVFIVLFKENFVLRILFYIFFCRLRWLFERSNIVCNWFWSEHLPTYNDRLCLLKLTLLKFFIWFQDYDFFLFFLKFWLSKSFCM